ncbi:NAD(P)-dependent oxidoreductase [Ramlibacter rhizophilus]|uniref:NAD(P)-dependent oxidoreductase n=1 Tax=Ramlibacter rhizophilus TaxID=1781167 RepID=A0A4Z0BCF2_9BURK|nr:NAD(P)-dependent oxidoreductase [Ramlibacter rhizophilus]TFY96390.1 NAD(P)-dependent oxidoreductase [Ramlibacter rhizophilus]
MDIRHIGLVGYGEVGKIFAAGLCGQAGVASVGAWDLKLAAGAAQREVERAHAAAAGVQACESLQSLCERSDLVISAVTASNTLAVAQEAAAFLRPGTVFLDLNSASPGTKQQAAAAVEAKGAHYVEAGVMTSVPPYGIRVPMLLGGAKALDLAPVLAAWGLDTKPVSTELGVASAIKMCRSVMIKGLEALVIESYTTARAYGVEDHVLPTLAETFPSIDWPRQGAYFFSRVVQHGQRRAEEMRESANTVREAGFEPLMTAAIADKQQWVADLAAAGVFQGLDKDAAWQAYADRLIARKARD